MPRILITGSREITFRSTVADALAAAWVELGSVPDTVCVHGTARGAESIAGQTANDNPDRLVEERHPANWRPEGPDGIVDRGAGYRRNELMISLGADVCIAFFKRGAGNRGTTHCRNAALAAGIRVIEVWEE